MSEPFFRRAEQADLPELIALLADDVLGETREDATAEMLPRYRTAFEDIQADPNQYLCVVEDGGTIVGTLQLSFIPGLVRGGARRGQIEAVRIARNRRGRGLGETMIAWAIALCRTRGCSLVQLTTDKARQDAHRFYDRLGFEATHIGYKMVL